MHTEKFIGADCKKLPESWKSTIINKKCLFFEQSLFGTLDVVVRAGRHMDIVQIKGLSFSLSPHFVVLLLEIHLRESRDLRSRRTL